MNLDIERFAGNNGLECAVELFPRGWMRLAHTEQTGWVLTGDLGIFILK